MYFTWRPIYYLWSYPAQFFLKWETSQTNVVEEIKTHFVLSNLFKKIVQFLRQWEKNIVGRGRPQMTTWRMRIAFLILKATNTHSEYVALFFFPLQQRLHERASTERLYVHCLCYIFYILWCTEEMFVVSSFFAFFFCHLLFVDWYKKGLNT